MPEPDYLSIITTFIADNTPFILGDNIRGNYFPQDAPDRCVLVKLGGGGAEYGETERRHFDMMIQVITRANNPSEAYEDARKIYDFLWTSGTSHRELPTGSPVFRAENISPVTTPQDVGRDDDNRFVFSINFKFQNWRL